MQNNIRVLHLLKLHIQRKNHFITIITLQETLASSWTTTSSDRIPAIFCSIQTHLKELLDTYFRKCHYVQNGTNTKQKANILLS